MQRTFAYARVSTLEQNPENQIKEIKEAGFTIESHRLITETISGSVPISRRKGFIRLLDKMEKGDILIVTKLDRLGRDAIDVSTTSSAGKMTMGVINAVAQFERDLLIERTQSSLARAKSNGKTLGRPKIFSELQKKQITQQLQEGNTIAAIARNFNTSRQTIMRIRDITDY